MKSRITILGAPVGPATWSEVRGDIERILRATGQHIVVTPNPEMLLTAQHDPVLRSVINRAAVAAPDGIGLVWALSRRGIRAERVPGVELMAHIGKRAATSGKRIFLLGGEHGTAQRTAARLQEYLPALVVAGWSQDADTIEVIRRANPDILFVALGVPKQEHWIAEHLAELPSVTIAMGVGGAFDILSGRLRRAPVWMRRMGLEWLWRLALEPRRLPRIWNAVVRFPLAVWREQSNT